MDRQYWRIRAAVRWAFGVLADMRVEGVEHIPPEGPGIIVTNHISRLDTPALLVASPRHVYPLAADKYRGFPGFNVLLNACGAIWIRRHEFDRDALRKALAVLERGDILGIAPEGTRSRSASLQEAKPGVAYLAVRSGAPLIPVGVTGTHTMGRDLLRLRKMQIRVVFGEPFVLPLNGRVSTEDLLEATGMIMRRVAALLPPAYQGVYAGAQRELRAEAV